ncbi:hypothetical protein DFH07DRAFT_705624, partial [Mycena maculata]
PLPCPANAAEWFIHSRDSMMKVNLGVHFNAMLAAWTRLETACGFENQKVTLPSKGRPEQVGRWITAARGRRNQPDPVVHDTEKYGIQWWRWWDSLQPEWRTKEPDRKTWVVGGEYGADWDSLAYWGVNGLLSVVASLYFWGCAVAGEEEETVEEWECAINNVAWMME